MSTLRRVACVVVALLCLWTVPLAAQENARKDDFPGRLAFGGAANFPDASALVADATATPWRLPIADAGPDLSAMVAVPVIVDGSKSHDPSGQLITFHWTIAGAPPGSAALLDASDPAPVFVPDLPGSYLLQLVVTNEDEVESPAARMMLVAFASSPFPNARAGKDRHVRVGAPVILDAGRSYDPLQRSLTYHWTLMSSPQASRIGDTDIMARDSAQPWFTPDAPGAYTLRLEASNGELTAEDRVTVTATFGNLAPIANAGWHQQVERGAPAALSGAASFDPDAGPSPLGFAWSLVARPQDSTLESSAIGNLDNAMANVTPDADGAYVFRLTVTDGDASDGDNVLVRQTTASAFDAEESAGRGHPAIIATPSMTAAAKPMDAKRLADFTLVARPAVLRVAVGDTGTFTIKVRASALNAGAARLDVAGLPRAVSATFAAQPLTLGASTTLTLRADANAPLGRYPLQITATEASTNIAIAHSASVLLRVTGAALGATPQLVCGVADLTALKTKIYVSPGGNDSANCGRTAARPCATIQRGIDNCSGGGCGVLVRYGRYSTTATTTLRDGVSVYGSCHFNGITTDNPTGASYRTVIDAVPAPGTPAISGEGINKPTVISGLVVLGKDEHAIGTASIAMAASRSGGITMTNSTLVAGDAGEGAPGRPSQGGAGGAGNPATDDRIGGKGGTACAANPSGGSGVGGQGGDLQVWGEADCGDLYCSCSDINPGSIGRSGLASGAVQGGGGGGRGGAGCGCAYVDGVPDGVGGNPGSTGSCSTQGGVAGDLFGTFRGATWIASTGGVGGVGSVGSGGGGGGAGGIALRVEFDADPLVWPGQPGGGGGGGGCGGPGGTGGGQGGASIALVLVASQIAGVPDSNSLVPGAGGMGGAGARGGTGGAGGPGAPGEKGHTISMDKPSVCSAEVPGAGAPGGPGGQGGAGSGGAGGNGGPSIGIALVGGSRDPGSATGIYSSLPGPGGSHGDGGQNVPTSADPSPCQGTSGSDGGTGGRALVYNADGVSPARLLLSGQQLASGQSITSPNGVYLFVMQGDGNLCLYDNDKPPPSNFMWCSETSGFPGLYAVMEPAGNLTVNQTGFGERFDSATDGHPGSDLAVQDNGKIVIYDGLTALWTKP